MKHQLLRIGGIIMIGLSIISLQRWNLDQIDNTTLSGLLIGPVVVIVVIFGIIVGIALLVNSMGPRVQDKVNNAFPTVVRFILGILFLFCLWVAFEIWIKR